MSEEVNEQFRSWLWRLAIEWAIPTDSVAKHLGRLEIANRNQHFPALGRAIAGRPLDIAEIKKAVKNCWVLAERFDAIQFNEFISNSASTAAIVQLADEFPIEDVEAADRIDSFIEKCGVLGYRDRKSNNLQASNAALFASTLLTAAFPTRFVDFRQTRWKELADELDYRLFDMEKPTYGEMIIAAGRFAGDISKTETFQELWPEGEPLWTIAGICWDANSEHGAKRPKDAPLFLYDEDFVEGDRVLRAHLIRERNQQVVAKAKELWRANDPLLHCDVCKFSFVEAYGELGEGFIEAHHTKPIHTLKAGSKAKVADLAKVCANCHRMLHVKGKCLELIELRTKLYRK